SDGDSDGLTDVQEFLKGSDPSLADADLDLLTDLVDDHPEDYYNGEAPSLAILGGNNQTAPVSTFNSQPFEIAVWNNNATAPLTGAPITFSVTAGGGSVATSTSGNPPLFSEYTLQTDIDGAAQIFYKHSSTVAVISEITATAGTAQVVFST